MGDRAIRDLRLVFSVDTGRAQAEIRKLKKEMGGVTRATRRTSAATKNLDKGTKRFMQTSNSLRATFASGWRKPIAQVRSDILMLTFALGGIIATVKSFIDASKEAEMALKGLSSIAGGFGHSVKGATAMAQEFADTGLLTIEEAANTLKYLLSMEGVSIDLARSAMKAAMDWAAFSRLGQYEFGQALQVWARGMKEQRSQVTDVIGWVTNLNNAWKKYAERLGKTVGHLTEAEKNIGGLTIMMEEGNAVLGDSADYLDTYAGQMSILRTAWREFSRFLGDTVLPVLKDVLKGVTPTVEKWKEYVKANKEVISVRIRDELTNLYDVLKALTPSLDTIAKSIDEIIIAMKILVPILAFRAGVKGIKLLGVGFLKAGGWVGSFATKVGGAVKFLWDMGVSLKIIVKQFGFWQAIKLLTGSIGTNLGIAAKALAGFVTSAQGLMKLGFLGFLASLGAAIHRMGKEWEDAHYRVERARGDISIIKDINTKVLAEHKDRMDKEIGEIDVREEYIREAWRERLKDHYSTAAEEKKIEDELLGLERERMDIRLAYHRHEFATIGKEILANKKAAVALQKFVGADKFMKEMLGGRIRLTEKTPASWMLKFVELLNKARNEFDNTSKEAKVLQKAINSLMISVENAPEKQAKLTEAVEQNRREVKEIIPWYAKWAGIAGEVERIWPKTDIGDFKKSREDALKIIGDSYNAINELRNDDFTLEVQSFERRRQELENYFRDGIISYQEWTRGVDILIQELAEKEKKYIRETKQEQLAKAEEIISKYMDLGRTLMAGVENALVSNREIQQQLSSELKNLQSQYAQGAIDRIELQRRTEKAIMDSEARMANNTAQMWKNMFSTVTDFMMDVFADYLKRQIQMKVASEGIMAGAGLGLLGGLALGAVGVGIGLLGAELFPKEDVSPYMPISPGGGGAGEQRRTFGSMAQAPVQNISIIPSVSIRGDNVWIGAGTVEELELGLEDLIKKTTQDAVDNNEIDLAGVGPR